MAFFKLMTVLVVLFVDGGHTGGHGGKHHDHVRLHMPEFIHHDHHTKVITIHHHHHKPKKEHHHHHHHHHHPKPVIPYGHNYHKHHTKLKTTTKVISNGKHHRHHPVHVHYDYQPQHDNHPHHGHPGFHSHRDHHSYHPPHQSPVYNEHKPTTFDEDFASYSPPAAAYPANINPHTPRVHGISHTVKQVNVFDSLPGALPVAPGNTNNDHNYAVTEDDENDDSFTAVNSLHKAYPSTYGFVREAAPSDNDPFAEPSPHIPSVPGVTAIQSHDPFATGPQSPDSFGNSIGDDDTFIHAGTVEGTPFPSFPGQDENSAQGTPDFTVAIHGDGNIEEPASFVGSTGSAFASGINHDDDTPVTFSREAGIQQTIKTGGIETLLY